MILYADTSALVKLIIDEQGTVQMRLAQATADLISSAAITYVELRAAAAAALRANRVPLSQRPGLTQSIEDLWETLSPVPIAEALLRRAGDLSERMRLRAYDAVHLASLEASGSAGDVTFACWDAALRRAASSLGYTLLSDA